MTDDPAVPAIRVKSLCVCRKAGRILVQDMADPATGERFFRPFGGAVEFGERAGDALRREFREELGTDLERTVFLGVVENIFTHDGRSSHEVVFVYDARLSDRGLYDRDDIVGRRSEGDPVPGLWVSPADIPGIGVPLYPEGLMALLLTAPAPNF